MEAMFHDELEEGIHIDGMAVELYPVPRDQFSAIDPRAIIGHLRLPRCWSEGLTMIQILFKQHDLRTTVGGSIMIPGPTHTQEAHGFSFTPRMINQI